MKATYDNIKIYQKIGVAVILIVSSSYFCSEEIKQGKTEAMSRIEEVKFYRSNKKVKSKLKSNSFTKTTSLGYLHKTKF